MLGMWGNMTSIPQRGNQFGSPVANPVSQAASVAPQTPQAASVAPRTQQAASVAPRTSQSQLQAASVAPRSSQSGLFGLWNRNTSVNWTAQSEPKRPKLIERLAFGDAHNNLAWMQVIPRPQDGSDPSLRRTRAQNKINWFSYLKNGELPKLVTDSKECMELELQQRDHLNANMRLCAVKGHDLRERADDLLQALLLQCFLAVEHPECQTSFAESGFAPTQAAFDMWRAGQINYLATEGSNKCKVSRNTWARFDKLMVRNSELLRDGTAYPVTVDVLAMFLTQISDEGRVKVSKKGWKGTGAGGFLKGLGTTQFLGFSPFKDEVLKHPKVVAASRPPPDASVQTSAAHMSLSVLLSLVDLASGETKVAGSAGTQELVRFYARCFLVCAITGVRLVEARRMEVTNIAQMFEVEEGREDVYMWCRGAKAHFMAATVGFEIAFSNAGLTGERLTWLRSWATPLMSRSFIFPEVEVKKGGAVEMPEGPAKQADAACINTMWHLVLALCALGLTTEEISAMTLTTHAFRHIFPDIARVMKMPMHQRNELGRWNNEIAQAEREAIALSEGLAPPKKKKAPQSAFTSMANHYSTIHGSRPREIELRAAVCAMVASHVGAEHWRKSVPEQRGAPPSFEFMVAARAKRDKPQGAAL
jgi:hypothetical protein